MSECYLCGHELQERTCHNCGHHNTQCFDCDLPKHDECACNHKTWPKKRKRFHHGTGSNEDDD